MRLSALRLGVCASVLAAGVATAQDSVARVCEIGPAADTAPALIYGNLYVVEPHDAKVSPDYLDDLLDQIRRAMRPVPVSFVTYSVRSKRARLAAVATVTFDVARDGKMSDILLAQSSLTPAFDHELLDAVQRLDSSGLVGPLPPHSPKRLGFYLTVSTEVVSDTAHLKPKRGIMRPLLQTAVPTWVGRMTTAGTTPGNTPPAYPEEARRASVGDELTLNFVIDETGHAVPRSALFTEGTYHVFVASVSDFMRRATFRPARINGCPVKALVQEPFKYSLTF